MSFIGRIFGRSKIDELKSTIKQRAEYKNAAHFAKLLKQRDTDISQTLAVNEQLSREGKIEPFKCSNGFIGQIICL